MSSGVRRPRSNVMCLPSLWKWGAHQAWGSHSPGVFFEAIFLVCWHQASGCAFLPHVDKLTSQKSPQEKHSMPGHRCLASKRAVQLGEVKENSQQKLPQLRLAEAMFVIRMFTLTISHCPFCIFCDVFPVCIIPFHFSLLWIKRERKNTLEI